MVLLLVPEDLTNLPCYKSSRIIPWNESNSLVTIVTLTSIRIKFCSSKTKRCQEFKYRVCHDRKIHHEVNQLFFEVLHVT